MATGSGVDWTAVLVALIAALPGLVTVVLTFLIRRQVKTPSGSTLGAVAERTHDLSAADVALSQHTLATVSGDAEGARRIVADVLNSVHQYEPRPRPLDK